MVQVIPYKRSELLATEVMERLCDAMKDFGIYTGVEGESQLIKVSLLREMELQDTRRDVFQKDMRAAERNCEELVDNFAEKITTSIRDGLNITEFVDQLCYGNGRALCGAERSECKPGTFGSHLGVAPCQLCPRGTWQSEFRATECYDCEVMHNTSAPGSKSSNNCMPVCAAGSFSNNGLDMTSDGGGACRPCEGARYQELTGMTSCERCPGGKNTLEPGAASLAQCVDKCGDGMKTDNEGCDDSNLAEGDGCSSQCVAEAGSICKHTHKQASACRLVVCGDGLLDASDDGTRVEDCDDGNTEDGDGCSSACAVEPGARCEDTKPGAKSTCGLVVCGDGKIQQSADGSVQEDCDDANDQDGDGCSSSCTVQSGYTCSAEGRRGSSRCRKVACGDKARDRSHDGSMEEGCDDGNQAGSDGCSAECRVEDGFICVGEPASERRPSMCSAVTCGDGYRESSGEIFPVSEECDDGNDVSGDGCSEFCRVEAGYECAESKDSKRRHHDAAHVTGPAGFLSAGRDACKRKEICGDGFRVGSEACDDGNAAGGDGCSAACLVEEGWKCAAPRPSADAPPPRPDEPLPDACVKKPAKKAKSVQSEL